MTPAAVRAATALPRRIPKLTSRDVVGVLGDLSDLLDAGCPLSRALTLLSRQAGRPPVRRLLERLSEDIVNGLALADALAGVDAHFSGVQIAMVRAAEMGGFLQKTLAHMAKFGRRRMEMLGRIRGAMTYPAVLLLTALASIVFLLAFVVPRFSRVYETAGADLPWATQFLMDVSAAAASYWWAALAAIAGALAAVNLLLRHEPIRLWLDGLLLRVPVLGPLLQQWALGEFSRCMALLLDGGVPVLRSLRLSGEVIGNRAMRTDVAVVAEGVGQGEAMGPLMAASRRFPASTTELIGIAEESGTLPAVMARLAEQFQRRLEMQLGVLMSLVEPVIVLMVGALVALIVAAMLLPVLLMNTLME